MRPHTNPLSLSADSTDASRWCSETYAAQHSSDIHSSDPVAGISTGQHPQLPINFAWKQSQAAVESEQHESYQAWPVSAVQV